MYLLILTKNCFGYILGKIFKNSSGHPELEVECIYVSMQGDQIGPQNVGGRNWDEIENLICTRFPGAPCT
jgi:hypothetical protein